VSGTPQTETVAPPGPGDAVRQRIGIGLVGFGWLGQAHTRSMQRIRTVFGERSFNPDLVICSDTQPDRARQAVESFGYGSSTDDWRRVVDDPGVDAVYVAAPNRMHLELIEAAAEAGKDIFCEKPVGGTPEQTVRAERAARRAGVITGVGYNFRWAPLVRHVAALIADGRVGEITNYRGRFFSMYGSDPLGLLSWRFLVDEGGHGASSDLLSHAVDLASMLVGPITRVVGAIETFIRERPLAKPGAGTHYGRGAEDDPKGAVTNEDYVSALCEFSSGAHGTFEASRTLVGPESQMAFDVYGTRGAAGWNLERLNELQLYLPSEDPNSGYLTVFGGERFPYHGSFVPGSANGIGFEDLVAIEDYEFCRAVVERRPFSPGFAEALACVSVQAALLRSVESGRWEEVISLREE
jgi:predicted dehydrogenase